MTRGRPSAYTSEMLETAREYVKDCTALDETQVIPTVAGLAVVIGVCKKTLYNWANEKGNEDFLHALGDLANKQEMALISGGLSNTFNATITKLMLCNHGYSDAVKADVTQQPVINIVNPDDNDKAD